MGWTRYRLGEIAVREPGAKNAMTDASGELVGRIVSAVQAAEFDFWCASPLAVGPAWKDGLVKALARATMRAVDTSLDEFQRLRQDNVEIRTLLKSVVRRAEEADARVARLVSEEMA